MENKEKIRLSQEEIRTIKDIITKYDPQAEILIFGSRTDLTKKGGDIDILIISKDIDYRIRRKIRVDLQLSLGNRKIDLIVTDNPEKTEFTKVAYKYGVKI
ncbi:Nucleotidyltransferase domain-containing protein [Balnearium lithotrophicum]|uniref:Nucleotidyltransferase domain-containing protein n=1 Tax=Balnearium lithotrophicum TaxID=223788 RepID=A0A521C8J3_9BACT|nr:nucleotidyltransferase domain-containing protein [Balnearium lithotrophicum]SMO55736.1 Nucleotidyltransferase domain-containing protein [Balnearium lithotrophicum]